MPYLWDEETIGLVAAGDLPQSPGDLPGEDGGCGARMASPNRTGIPGPPSVSVSLFFWHLSPPEC